jgi:predicted dehydrogenase
VHAAGHRVVGAFGSSAEGSARFARQFGATAYESMDEMLADEAVEAVWVASPTALHPAHARAAVAAGRAVLVEKPLAATADEAARLADELSGAPVLSATGFQHRFNPAVAAIADALADGRIGTLSSLVIQHAMAGPPAPTAWRTDQAASGGWSIADLGAHLLDIARYLLDDVAFWAARLSSPTRGLAVDDLSWVVLAHGEATVVVRASTGTPGPASYIEASGADGWVRVTDFWMGGGRLVDSTGRDEPITQADLYAAQADAFSAAVAGAAWPGASLADGVAVVDLMDAAHRFGRERVVRTA